MSHSKIRTLVFLMMFVFASSLYCEEAVDVSSKLRSITDDYLIFDVIIKNNTDRNLYFYPEGAMGFLRAVDDTFLVIPNKKLKYRYKIRIHYKSKIPRDNLSKEDVLAVPKIAY